MARRKITDREIKRYWLSYDLGLRGNYDALYEWLDAKGAQECGDSVATFRSELSSDEICQALLEILGKDSKARVYLYPVTTGGKFLIGSRKPAPWAGYFQAAVENVLDQ